MVNYTAEIHPFLDYDCSDEKLENYEVVRSVDAHHFRIDHQSEFTSSDGTHWHNVQIQIQKESELANDANLKRRTKSGTTLRQSTATTATLLIEHGTEIPGAKLRELWRHLSIPKTKISVNKGRLWKNGKAVKYKDVTDNVGEQWRWSGDKDEGNGEGGSKGKERERKLTAKEKKGRKYKEDMERFV